MPITPANIISTIPAHFLGTRFFGIGDTSRVMTTADGKTLDQLIAQTGLAFCNPYSTAKFGPPTAPNSAIADGFWINDAVVAAGQGWGLKYRVGPTGWGRTSGDPALSPAGIPGNQAATDGSPSGTNGLVDYINYCAGRWGANKCYGQITIDNEWAGNESGATALYWYTAHTGYNASDWGSVNFRYYVNAAKAAISGVEVYGFDYSYGSNPNVGYFQPPGSQLDRYLFGTGMTNVGWAGGTYSWPHGTSYNTNFGGVAVHVYGSEFGTNASQTVASFISSMSTFRNNYKNNMNYMRTKVAASMKASQEEWWAVSRDNAAWDGISCSREAIGHIIGFVDHVNNPSWNMQQLIFWGIGPRQPNTGGSPESWIMVSAANKLLRFPTYYAIRDMLCPFMNTYPNVVQATFGLCDGVAAVNNAGNGLIALIVNLNSTAQTIDTTGFASITNVKRLPASLAIDTALNDLGTSVPAQIQPLEAVVITGVPSSSPPPPPPPSGGPSTPVLDTFTGIGNAIALSVYDPTHWGKGPDPGSTGELLGDGANAITSGSGWDNNYWKTLFTPDQDVFVTLTTIGTSYIQLYARIASIVAGADFYYFWYRISDHQFRLRRQQGGVDTLLASTTAYTLVNGDKMWLRVTGSGTTVTLTGYAYTGGTWTQVLTYADTDALRLTNSGYIGLESATGGTWKLDDFGGGGGVLGPASAYSIPRSHMVVG